MNILRDTLVCGLFMHEFIIVGRRKYIIECAVRVDMV